MIRFFLFFLGVFFLSGYPAQAQQEVSVRGAEHEGYSRIVFDWDDIVGYEIQKPDEQTIVIEFEKSGSLNSASFSGLKNIFAVRSLSENPLKAELSVSQNRRLRDFLAGTRAVIDIYDGPPGVRKAPEAKPQEEEQVSSPEAEERQAEDEKVTVQQAEIPAPPEEKLQEVAQSDEKQAEEKSDSEVTILNQSEEAEKTEEIEPPPPASSVLTEAVKNQPSLITVSSTSSSGMAVYSHAGAVWMVNDQADLFLKPQVSGPARERILPLESFSNDEARIFRANLPEDLSVKADGGGLVWRVVLSKNPDQRNPVGLVRTDVSADKIRSGKLLWPVPNARKVIDFTDPVTGKDLKIVTVETGKEYAGMGADFVEFEILPSAIGLAIYPKVDDLEVKKTDEGIEISRSGGLFLTQDITLKKAESLRALKSTAGNQTNKQRIFDFQTWSMGGIPALEQNKNIILSSLVESEEMQRLESILTLGKMYLANGMAPEALGFLRIASATLPELSDNPEFAAMEGVALALHKDSEAAFDRLTLPALQPYEEIQYWRTLALSELGDWQQAEEVMPAETTLLKNYPPYVSIPLGLSLAEVALRSGNVNLGKDILSVVQTQEDYIRPPEQAAWDYLKGEAARQEGDLDRTKELWAGLAKGTDDLYRAKAGLALTRLLMEEGEINAERAIDNLERLRYAWRGDLLEAQINYWLGKIYFDSGNYIKGLNTLRESAGLAVGTELGPRITADMSDMFTSVFIGDELSELSPLDATALYEQFPELVPSGERGDKVIERLSEHLVEADLLPRAANLLQHRLDFRIQDPLDGYRTGIRLAAINLLDNEPEKALAALNTAKARLQKIPEEQRAPTYDSEISLLRARALSQQKRADQAIALLRDLQPSKAVNRLKADIAWNAGYWDDAAAALEDVVLDNNISLTRPLSKENADLLLNRAIALNLSNDRVGLANMREKYADAMLQTEHAKIFEVITRPRQNAGLSDRETLSSIVSEVDLFSDFLNSYKSVTPPESSAE